MCSRKGVTIHSVFCVSQTCIAEQWSSTTRAASFQGSIGSSVKGDTKDGLTWGLACSKQGRFMAESHSQMSLQITC